MAASLSVLKFTACAQKLAARPINRPKKGSSARRPEWRQWGDVVLAAGHASVAVRLIPPNLHSGPSILTQNGVVCSQSRILGSFRRITATNGAGINDLLLQEGISSHCNNGMA